MVGGATGCVLRGALSASWTRATKKIHAGTLFANVAGSFLFGFISSCLSENESRDPGVLAALLLAGFCGGLTTFSGFACQTLGLWKEKVAPAAMLNVAVHFLACTGAVRLGALIAMPAPGLEASVTAAAFHGTLGANILGSFLAGWAVARLQGVREMTAFRINAVFVTGFCGGLTTFSGMAWQVNAGSVPALLGNIILGAIAVLAGNRLGSKYPGSK